MKRNGSVTVCALNLHGLCSLVFEQKLDRNMNIKKKKKNPTIIIILRVSYHEVPVMFKTRNVIYSTFYLHLLEVFLSFFLF